MFIIKFDYITNEIRTSFTKKMSNNNLISMFCVYVCVCVYVCKFVCVCLCLCVCVCKCMCVCV